MTVEKLLEILDPVNQRSFPIDAGTIEAVDIDILNGAINQTNILHPYSLNLNNQYVPLAMLDLGSEISRNCSDYVLLDKDTYNKYKFIINKIILSEGTSFLHSKNVTKRKFTNRVVDLVLREKNRILKSRGCTNVIKGSSYLSITPPNIVLNYPYVISKTYGQCMVSGKVYFVVLINREYISTLVQNIILNRDLDISQFKMLLSVEHPKTSEELDRTVKLISYFHNTVESWKSVGISYEECGDYEIESEIFRYPTSSSRSIRKVVREKEEFKEKFVKSLSVEKEVIV